MTPKDNELRMQVGLVVTHTDEELLFTRSEKYANTLDALQAFADLVRQDEREEIAKWLNTGVDFKALEKDPFLLQFASSMIAKISVAIKARGAK